MDYGIMEQIETNASYFEMGYMQGEVFRESIKKAVDVIVSLPAVKSMKPSFVPSSLFPFIAGRRIFKEFVSYMAFTPDVWKRFGGMVEGSGVSKEVLAFLHMGEVFLNRGSYDVPSDACTAVAFFPSLFGKMVVMKNFDYPPSIREFNLLRYSKPKDGIPVIEFTKTPVAIAHDGMNEYGLVVTYNYASSIDSPQRGPMIGALVSHILTHAKDVDEALSIVMEYKHAPSAGILLLADKKKAVAVEISPNKRMVRYPHTGTYIAHTNHFQIDEMISHQIPWNAVFKSGPHRGKRILESSLKRLKRIESLMEKGAINSLDDVFMLARDHGDEGVPGNNTICRHGEPTSATIMSAIFVPEDGVIYYRGGNPCEGPYGQIAFK